MTEKDDEKFHSSGVILQSICKRRLVHISKNLRKGVIHKNVKNLMLLERHEINY